MTSLAGTCARVVASVALLPLPVACSEAPPAALEGRVPAAFAPAGTVLLLVPAGPSDKPLPSLMLTAVDPATLQQDFGPAVADAAPLLLVEAAAMQAVLAELDSGRVQLLTPPPPPFSYQLTLLHGSDRWQCLLGFDGLATLLTDLRPAAEAGSEGIMAWRQLRQWLKLPPQ